MMSITPRRNNYNEAIEVVDGEKEGLEENLLKFKTFLQEKGEGKHVLVDEVPITLGFQENITSEALSKHWEWVKYMIGGPPPIKSITISFRPNDPSYARDFPLEDVRPGRFNVTVLESVKRNSRKVAELFLAIGNYSRRIFISQEKTIPLRMKQSGNGFLPALSPIPSCSSIHPSECRNEKICEVVRAFHIIHGIYEEQSKSSEKIPLFVVVDHERRRNALVNIFASLDPSLPLIFLSDRKYQFHGSESAKNSIPIVVVTESEFIGCHPKNMIVVVDFAQSEWKNYARLAATTGENKIIVFEEEQLRTGKFFRLTKEVPGIVERSFDEGFKSDLKVRLEKAWQECDAEKIECMEEKAFPLASFPGMTLDWGGREKEEESDVELMLKHGLSIIFGPAASGKSRRLNMLIKRVTEKGDQVFLIHQGSILSLEEYQRRWSAKENVEFEERSITINSLGNIIRRVEMYQKRKEEEKEKEEEGKKGEEEGKEEESIIWKKRKTKGYVMEEKKRGKKGGEKQEGRLLTVIVEDCPFLIDLQETRAAQWGKHRGQSAPGLAYQGAPHGTPLGSLGRRGSWASKGPQGGSQGATGLVLPWAPGNLWAPLQETMIRLKEMKVRLILSIKPHSAKASRETVRRTIEFLKENPDSTAIEIQSQPTNVLLLQHIQKNETAKALNLRVKSLSVFAVPATIVPGPPVKYISMKNYKCSGRHLGYLCKGEKSCSAKVAAVSGLSRAIFPKTTNNQPHVLVSDKDLLTSLQSLKTRFDVQVIHPKEFRGCEASVIVSVNVNDEWLLEVISRSRTQLIIIDIDNREDLWQTMIEEQRVEVQDDFSPEYILHSYSEIFVGEPTWDDSAKRIAEEAVKRETCFDQETGKINCLSAKTWEVLNKVLPLPKDSSPFTDWGYAWNDWPGEALLVEHPTTITDFLKMNGVQWETKKWPPVPLKTQSSRLGILESLSLALTGSLLHLPLLKRILGEEDPQDPLPLIQKGADILKRPIVLMGKKLSDTTSRMGPPELLKLMKLQLSSEELMDSLRHVAVHPVFQYP
ncbi:unnamed protein product [Darwinula stevensoni]|uniref:Uncharacterized protein n=1 Tax=Darwinula stevensoni TaxID=69355 RepID=A0A7R8X3A4_9CRUS|nr:unnamed protein product [Darwinula stevensoni]CAG0882330.1 unnamed protein product [Darwinula stevensoni]